MRICFSDFIILTHMDFDIQVDNLGCDSRVFHRFVHGPDSPLEGPSLGQLESHGSRGFSRTGKTAMYSNGELVNVLPEKGKEDC